MEQRKKDASAYRCFPEIFKRPLRASSVATPMWTFTTEGIHAHHTEKNRLMKRRFSGQNKVLQEFSAVHTKHFHNVLVVHPAYKDMVIRIQECVRCQDIMGVFH